jgi:hypothetical protein
VSILLRYKVDISSQLSQDGVFDSGTPLFRACSGGHAHIVSLLFESGANVKALMKVKLGSPTLSFL